MSSESDQVVFENALEPYDNTTLFQSKKWGYITDNTTTGGKFTGQFAFNLNTLTNINHWSHLNQSVINYPVKLSLTRIGGGGVDEGEGATPEGPCSPSMMTACIKNGFHQFTDSVQVQIGGAGIQSTQIYENVNTTFKILSEWSLDEFNKYGPSLGLSLDDYQLALDDGTSTYKGLGNTPATTTIPASKGFTIPPEANPGFKARAHHINSDHTSSTTLNTLLKEPTTFGKGVFEINTLPKENENAFTMMAIATIRLKDISDVCAKLPPMKNITGYIYINYNSASYTFSTDKETGAIIKDSSQSPIYGRTMPGMLGTFKGGTSTVADFKWKFTAEVSGETVGSCKVAHNNARLHVPYYVANPEVDRALSHKKTLRYNERFVTTINVKSGEGYSGTITPGITNPKRIVLLPMLTGTNTGVAGNVSALSTNPSLNVWSHEPAGSGPFAGINNLQFTIGGVPMYQTPIDMDYQTFVQEISQLGENGGLESTEGSGLLNQRLWNELYRFYTCDISRRMGSDDGASKAIQVSFTNRSNADMQVIAWVLYEKEIEIDTVLGSITQGV